MGLIVVYKLVGIVIVAIGVVGYFIINLTKNPKDK